MEKRFNEVKGLYFKKLEKIIPIVARVHGPHHPEFYDVQKAFEVINDKSKTNFLELKDELKNLREITNNYKVPSDVCETYEAVYKMLAEVDKAYFG